MKAVIMAGGEGTRLRPLTCTSPKPLAPLCGKPAVFYILELLKSHGFTEAVFTLRYQGEKIEESFDDNSYKGTALSFKYEASPLGTAGSVKNAVGNEDTLVISGDALCDFDLTAAIDFHKRKGSKATIIVKKVADPREYGLVQTDHDGRIIGFLEKPSYEGCVTDLANTGVYILSKEVMEGMSRDRPLDFAADVFPALLRDNIPLYAYEESGYWCDIGDFSGYLSCQKDMLAGKVNCSIPGHKTLNGTISGGSSDYRGVRITPPVYIGKNVKISPGAVIDSGSVIGDDVTICAGAKIHGSVILDGAYIGERATCNDAVICENARLLSSSAVYEGGVVGGNAVVGENAVVENGVKIWTGKRVDAGATAGFDIKYGNARRFSLDDEGFCGETGGEITPQVAALFGSAAASLGKIIAVGRNGSPASNALCMAAISGILSSGGTVWNLGECTETELDFALRQGAPSAGCYISAGVTAKLKIFGKHGLPLTRAEERKVENGMNRGEFPRMSFGGFGEVLDMSSLKVLYAEELKSLVPPRLKGIKAEISAADAGIKRILSPILEEINDRDGERVVFHISSDGRKLSAFSEDAGYIFYEKLLLMACGILLRGGMTAPLPYSAPAAADFLVQSYGGEIPRYYHCSADGSDDTARKAAAREPFARDALRLALLILGNLSGREISIGRAAAELPSFTAASRFVSIEKPPAEALRILCSKKAGLSEGIIPDCDGGRILIRPIKNGKGVMLFAESFKAETASELCDVYEKLLSDKCRAE